MSEQIDARTTDYHPSCTAGTYHPRAPDHGGPHGGERTPYYSERPYIGVKGPYGSERSHAGKGALEDEQANRGEL